MKTLEQHWIEYRDSCYPNGIAPEQQAEVRQAFISGVYFAMTFHMNNTRRCNEQEAVAQVAAMYKQAKEACMDRAAQLLAKSAEGLN